MSENPTNEITSGFATPKRFNLVPDVKPSWIWEPFIPLGDVTIVEGDGMAGKTTAMIRLASMITNGEVPPAMVDGELIESQSVEPADVLYIGIESNNETEIMPAIRHGKGNPDRLFFLDQSEHGFILNEEHLTNAIENTKCKLVIIDPYSNFLPEGYSTTDGKKMRPLLTRLKKVARATNTAVILIGHLTKNQYGKAIYSGYGSADIVNTVRSVLLVESDDHGMRTLRILKSNYFGVDPTFKIALHMDDDNCVQFEDYNRILDIYRKEEEELASYIPKGNTQPETRSGQCKLILEEILAEGPMKKSDVVAKLKVMGFAERTISRAFKGMGGNSYFEGRTGYWKLPEIEEDIDR